MAEEVGNLKVKLGMDTAQFDKSISSLSRNMRAIGNELKGLKNKGTEWGNSLTGLKAKQETLNRALSTQKQQVQALESAYNKSVAGKGKDAKATEELYIKLKRAEAEYNRFETELNQVTSALDKQQSEVRKSTSGLNNFATAASKLSGTIKNVGSTMKSAGQTMSAAITLPVAALGTGAVKAAIDFESAFTGVKKTVDGSAKDFANLEKGIRNMSKEIPASASEIAAVAESAGQLGIAKENIISFSRTIIDLGNSTNLTAEQAATEFARFANITGMSQKDFDRLGSSIVALGNNFATTESEISSMAMRLAGQGKQVHMNESQIMALAAAMSSLGIEAEAGGTAMSTILNKMQTAVSNGGTKLEAFGKAAGMSGSEFKKAFETDAAGALDALIKGLGNSSKHGANLNEILGTLGIKGVRESDTLKRLAGSGDLLSRALKTSGDGWKENSALTKEAETRYKTTASQLKVFKNTIVDLGITLGNILIPKLLTLVNSIKPLVEKFASLSSGTQTFIMAIAGIAAAIGPVLIVVGMLTSSIGSIVGVLGTVTGAIATAGGGMAVFGGALAALTGPIGLTIMGLTALGVGAVALVNHLRKPSIEATAFGDNVSKGTQKAVNGFLDLNNKATVALNQLSWSGQTVTGEMANGIISTFDKMGSQVLSAMQSKHEKQLTATQDFFARSNTLSTTEEAKIVANVQKSQEEQQQKVTDGQNRIKEILTTAKGEKRAITEAERTEINTIQENMKNTAVQVMSKNQAEQKVILETLKNDASRITAEQAAAVVKNSNDQKNKVVSDANKQYKDSIAEIIRMRDESKVISKDQANKLIAEAKRQKDETIKKATETHNKVVSEAKSQAKDHVDQVDWETGKVKSKWQVLKTDISSKMKSISKSISDNWDSALKATSNKAGDIKNTAQSKFKDMVNGVKTKMDDVNSKVASGWKKAEKYLSGIDLKTIGKNIIQGLANGINSMKDTVEKKVKSIADSVTGTIKKALDIHSPSRVTFTLGGYAIIESNERTKVNSIKMVEILTNPFIWELKVV